MCFRSLERPSNNAPASREGTPLLRCCIDNGIDSNGLITMYERKVPYLCECESDGVFFFSPHVC